MTRRAMWGDRAVLLFPLLFLAAFFFYPLVSILAEGLTDGNGRLTLAHLAGVFADGPTVRAIVFTVEQAALSTAASILLGLPGAWLLARFDFRGKSVIKSLCTIPFVLPSIVVVLGFVIVFGNNGLLNRGLMGLFGLGDPPIRVLYTLGAIVLAHTFYNFPIAIRLVSAVWGRVNPNLERAARNLGATGFRLFWSVHLPAIAPGLFAAAALIFIFCFTSFAVILVLGGGPRYTTIEVAIYRLAKVSLDLKTGSALAVVECMLSALFMYVYIRLQHGAGFAVKGEGAAELRRLGELFRRRSFENADPGARPPKGPWNLSQGVPLLGGAVLLYLALAFILIAAPMLAAVGYSFLERSGWAGKTVFSLVWYRRILAGPGAGPGVLAVTYFAAVRNSLLFGLATVIFSLPIGTAIAYVSSRRVSAIRDRARMGLPGRGVFEALAMLPLGVSSIILGLGYIKAYQGPPLAIGGTWYAIAFAHTVIAYPFVIRSTSAVFRKINPNVVHAALGLGASPWRVFWRVELPLIRAGIVAGAVFAFAVSIGEVNATLMLYNPKLTTLPIAVYRLISSYNYFAACALGTVLMGICFLMFLVIDKIGFEVS